MHQNANGLLGNAGPASPGRVTYQLLESGWPSIVKNPAGVKSTDEFAVLIDKAPLFRKLAL